MYAFPFWILELAINMTQSMMGGTMRAMGYQTIATVTGVISYWIIMLPCAYLICFTFEYRLRGIWLGIIFGSFLQASSYLYIVITAPWEKLATAASHHIPTNKISIENLLEEN